MCNLYEIDSLDGMLEKFYKENDTLEKLLLTGIVYDELYVGIYNQLVNYENSEKEHDFGFDPRFDTIRKNNRGNKLINLINQYLYRGQKEFNKRIQLMKKLKNLKSKNEQGLLRNNRSLKKYHLQYAVDTCKLGMELDTFWKAYQGQIQLCRRQDLSLDTPLSYLYPVLGTMSGWLFESLMIVSEGWEFYLKSLNVSEFIKWQELDFDTFKKHFLYYVTASIPEYFNHSQTLRGIFCYSNDEELHPLKMNLEEVYLRCGGLTREDLRKQNLIKEAKIDQFIKMRNEYFSNNPDSEEFELDIDELGVPDNKRLLNCIVAVLQDKLLDEKRKSEK